MTEFEVTNVVGTINFQRELDLSELANTFEDREEMSSVLYEPSENHWLQTRLNPDDIYVPFYRSGKCAVVGATSRNHFQEIVDRIITLMCELLESDYKPNTELNNIVATSQLQSFHSLETIAIGLGLEETEYEPEQFPAVIHRDEESVFLIFNNGKLICTGLTDIDKISTSIKTVKKRVEKFSDE